MSEIFDLVIVGAGPGGLAAAATAGEAGMSVCLIDDNFAPGGQIWRSGVSAPSAKAAAWLKRIEKSDTVLRSGWRAIAASTAGQLKAPGIRLERDGSFEDIEGASLILAPGASELFLPFPGWTLPGVYGVGGLQAFVKSGLDVHGKRIVIAGTGPLLLAIAAGLRSAGAHVQVIVEQAPMLKLAGFSLRLLAGHPGKLIEGAGYGWKTLGVPYSTGCWITSASGHGRVESVTLLNGSRTSQIETDMLAVGYHLVPNDELPRLLNCALRDGFVAVDAMQQTSRDKVYCVGEATGIGGVDKAELEGRIAALAAGGRTREAEALMPARDRQRVFVRDLAAAFRLREELRSLAAPETIVCRCEDVRQADIAECRSWREAKLHTRMGMGPCQGRICSAAAHVLYGWEPPAPRPPLFPVEVGALAGSGPSLARS